MGKTPAEIEARRQYDREYQAKYRAANRQKLRELNRVWCAKNKERVAARNKQRYQEKRSWVLLRKYGLTPEDYQRMLAAQGGACAICNATEPGGRYTMMHVDHCHAGGQIRGLLCNACNHLLGCARDNVKTLQAAIDYLDRARVTSNPELDSSCAGLETP